MYSAMSWRLELARRAADVYAAQPNVTAVVVAGSVGRGRADDYSDVELDVYWRAPPTEEERRQSMVALAAELIEFWPWEDDEWSESYTYQGVQFDVSNVLASTIDGYIADLLQGDTAWTIQCRLSALRHGVVLVGKLGVERWVEQTDDYPQALRRAMIEDNLSEVGLKSWYMREVLLARRDYLMLAEILVRMQQRMMGALLGLNRIYLSHPQFKWLDDTLREMALVPRDFGERLRQTHGSPCFKATDVMQQLLCDTIELVQRHLPEVDVSGARRAVSRVRRAVLAGSQGT